MYRQIFQTLQNIPNKAGVYKYFDKNSKLLYIGKAKNLKSRLKSYWRFTPNFHPNPTLSLRILRMLSQSIRIEYIVVETEEDALILENSLIKQLNPKYNILLKDDKTYPYICIDENQDFPRFELIRKVIKDKNIIYYGPFPTGGKVLLDALYEVFPLVQKKSCLREGKACLFYQIGKCLAPCEKRVSKEKYFDIVKQAKDAITKRKILIEALSEKMINLAMAERFEEAGKLRDNIKALTISSNLDFLSKEEIEIKIAELFELNTTPYRVESFDNSHMMGVATVGAMVVWEEGKWLKKDYRRYKLKAKDEYGQMKEMLTRRIESFSKNSAPNLWILDGGETLRRLAVKLLKDSNINLDIIAIAKEKLDAKAYRAKGSAKDIIYTKESVFELKTTDKRLQWVQRQRDEAHRFAITYHQNRKRKEDMQSSLLQKKGIGPATVKKLLNYFGTFQAIKNANYQEISVASSEKVAKILKT